ncbi:MAG: dienelactone hydrolase family protein [Planctomycetaceae bacterium]
MPTWYTLPTRRWFHRSLFAGALLALLVGTTSDAHAQAIGDETPPEVRLVPQADQLPLTGTSKLSQEGDLADQLVQGVDRFLLRELSESVKDRATFWKRDFASPEAYQQSIEKNRQRLAFILGVRDERVPFEEPELVSTLETPAIVAQIGMASVVYQVRWPVVRGVWAEGLLAVPLRNEETPSISAVIAIPDADVTPQQYFGIKAGLEPQRQLARQLAERGYRVLVPQLISRTVNHRSFHSPTQGPKLSNREFVYRPAFEMGRHILGYETQEVLAGVDWLSAHKKGRISVAGTGEGGLIALLATALDTRVDSLLVRGFFGPREASYQEPIDRNVFGMLEQFGGAELLTLVAPRPVVIDAQDYPHVSLKSEGGAPAELGDVPLEQVASELGRTVALLKEGFGKWTLATSEAASLSATAKEKLAASKVEVVADGVSTLYGAGLENPLLVKPLRQVPLDDAAIEQRLIKSIMADTQDLLSTSDAVRTKFLKPLHDSPTPEAYNTKLEEYRRKFATEVIGEFDNPLIPLDKAEPRSRKAYETDKWIGYEVVMDVFPDVVAYGILLVPKNLPAGEKRPVIVCQHGLEGRPQDVIGPQMKEAYSGFAGRLAEQGYITFAPQNLYIGKDKFRTLQRKANPLGKTLFSVIVPQHKQICKWLKTLPFVDEKRIAFYGLSYGGKSAMRIPPLVDDYCLSICSADFNEWVYKNATTRAPYSYVWTGEYEIFEFDMGNTFNYAEMAALICPRPFMVERGHFDGVGVDEWVAFEFAKVRNHYEVKRRLPDRCEIAFFIGPHKIHGQATFAFLKKHLGYPEK